MNKRKSVISEYLSFDIQVSSNDARTHSVATEEADVDFMIDQTVNYFKGLIKAYEKANELRLQRVGN